MTTIISDSTLTDHGGSRWNLSPGDILPFGGGDQAFGLVTPHHLKLLEEPPPAGALRGISQHSAR